ncbi:MAG: cation transporter [Saprospiraceae bacterium]|nr:cation transporter [Saprospiraceae bacterium]
MTHEYQISGITCEGCVTKVKSLLEKVPGITEARVGLDGKVVLRMERHVPTSALQAALRESPRYQLSETPVTPEAASEESSDKNFWQTYRPVLMVFAYILGVTLLVEAMAGVFDGMRWMRHFMAGFFLVFSFFKLLDVPAFAASYSSYDVLARKWPGWGYLYPWVELSLGILFLLNVGPVWVNSLTFVVMGISLIGVVQSLRAKRRFQCACLGAVFNLPMSNITLFEDALMVAMSAAMLILTV